MTGWERVGAVAERIAAQLAELEIGRLELEGWQTRAAWCAGERRGHRYARRLYRIVNAGGHVGVGLACERCGEGRRLIPHERLRGTGLALDALPLLEDRSGERTCIRCGRPGAELHHWAPRALFDDADDWPQDLLCPACRARWHQVTQTNGLPEREVLPIG